MILTALYYVCSVGINYNVHHLKKTKPYETFKGRNCKTYRNVALENEMAGKGTRVKIKTIISL
jgi:hypothetical protein